MDPAPGGGVPPAVPPASSAVCADPLGGGEPVGVDGLLVHERDNLGVTAAAFDALERDFKDVLNEIVGGKNLEKFRVEYEKLHATLKRSYENEKRLVKKCRELNQEIVANAAKIQTALRLSVQDQNSITLLKKELDKAWRMIDGAQEKERRARDTIQRLKVEIQSLSLLVDQGAGLSIGQENAVNELLKIKEDLTKEVEMHVKTIDATNALMRELSSKNAQLEQVITTMQKDADKLAEEKKQLQEHAARERSTAAQFQQQMVNVQRAHEDTVKDLTAKQAALTERDDRIRELEGKVREAEAARERFHQLAEDLRRRNTQLDKDRQTHAELESKALTEKQAAIDESLEKAKELRKVREKLREETLARQKAERDREQMGEKRAQSEKYKDWLKGQMKTVLQSFEAQRKDAEVDERIISELQTQVKRLAASVHAANQKNSDQFRLVEDAELVKKTLEEDILSHKVEEQQLRKRNYMLEKQREKAAMTAALWHAKFSEASEQAKLKEVEIAELNAQISEERNKLKLQQSLYEQVRSDRNKCSKQQAQQKDDISEMKHKFAMMAHQIEQLKEEIQNKDNALINEHFACKRLQAEMKVAKRKLNKRKEVLATADQVLSSQDSEIKALRRQLIEAEVAHHQQERAYDELMQERDILGTQLIRRNDELALLYEKVRIQQSTLNKGEVQYRERLQDLRALKIAINNLKQELQIRSQEVTNIDALKNEVYHIQRELLHERTKVKALSEELENPMNVHRWRNLEGSDPKKFELIQKIHTLQKRLISKTEEVVGRDMQLEEKERAYLALKKVVARHPGPELAEQLTVYQTALKDKTRQMRAMAAELNLFQAQANEYKYEVDKISREHQDVKKKYFEQRKQELLTKQKSKTATQTLKADPLFQQQRTFFASQPKIVGGGFNLSTTLPSQHNQQQQAQPQ